MLGVGPKRPAAPSNGDKPELPPTRRWRVRRLNPLKKDEIEELIIEAHGVEYGPVLAFQSGFIHESGQVLVQIKRAFHSWEDFEELEPVPESRLIH